MPTKLSTIPQLTDILLTFMVFTPIICIQNEAIDDILFLPYIHRKGAFLPLGVGIGLEFLLCYCQNELFQLTPKVRKSFYNPGGHSH